MTGPIRSEKPFTWVSSKPQKDNAIKGAAEKVARAVLDVNLLLKLPNDLRNNIVKSLTENDLDALEISLSKGEKIQIPFKPAKKNLQELIVKTRQNYTYENLLRDHPEWKQTVEEWKVTLEEKIWLMRIHELGILNVIPEMRKLFPENTLGKNFVPSKNSVKLLKIRKQILITLGQVTGLTLHRTGITKCPNAICLLVNLKSLEIHLETNLIEPPDLRLNKQLEKLDISDCNQLTDPIDLSCNEKLIHLRMDLTGLNKTPSLEKNVKLKFLSLSRNQLTEAPNLAKNVRLERVNLSSNKLTNAPNVRSLKELKVLELGNNPITEPPDLQHNLELTDLYMSWCAAKRVPDFTKNKKLKTVFYSNKSLPDEEKEKLAILRQEGKNIVF